MSLPDTFSAPTRRGLLALIGIGALVAVSACSFAPVYGSGARDYNLNFASPNTRLEQIVYQDLVTRFGRSSSPDALLVTVAVSSSSRLGVTLTGDISVTRPDGQIVLRETRSASATEPSATQSLAQQQAEIDAAERAAHQLAEAVRLTLLAGLPGDGAPAMTITTQ